MEGGIEEERQEMDDEPIAIVQARALELRPSQWGWRRRKEEGRFTDGRIA